MSLIQAIETTKPRQGFLSYKVFIRGRLVEVVDDRNLLVDNSKTILAHLIAGDTTNRIVTKIGFGTNGTAPVGGDTALTDLYSRAIGTITYPTSASVQFAWQLDTSEANGLAIMEFGLVTANDALFSRRTRATALNKTSDMSLTGTWRINF